MMEFVQDFSVGTVVKFDILLIMSAKCASCKCNYSYYVDFAVTYIKNFPYYW